MGRKSVDQLMKLGFELLEAQDFEGAIGVGQELQARRHTSAFEILAMAYTGLDDIQHAIEVLEEGVQRGPTVWKLWHSLGNCRADLGRYIEAHQAYRRALDCPDVDASFVHLNISVTLSRQERHEDALAELAFVTDADRRFWVGAQKISILNDAGRAEEAVAVGEELLAGLPPDINDNLRTRILTSLGRAYWQARKDGDGATLLAREALQYTPAYPEALWIIREAEGQRSKEAKYLRLIIEGDWPDPDEQARETGFLISFDVVADNAEEALRYARQFEPQEVRDSLRVNECEEVEPRPNGPKGVYWYAGHISFARDSQDDLAPPESSP